MLAQLSYMKPYFIRAAAMLLIFGLFIIFVRQPFIIEVLNFIFIFAIYSLSWSLMANSGQISLGHAVFFGAGAYASTLLARNLGMPPPLAVLIGPLVAALIGLGIGRLCIGLREWFLGMVTFGFSVIAQLIVVEQLGWLTNRWDGLKVPRLVPPEVPLETTTVLNYFIALTAMVGTYLIVAAVMRSRIGLAFLAMHDNELVANIYGVNVRRYRLFAFALGGYLAGLAGSINSHTLTRYISPEIFGLENSIWPLLYSIAGGVRMAEGPILGTLVIRAFWEWMVRYIGGFPAMLVIGLFLAVLVIFAPQGIFATLTKLRKATPTNLRTRRHILPAKS